MMIVQAMPTEVASPKLYFDHRRNTKGEKPPFYET